MKKILLSVFLTLFVSYTAHGEGIAPSLLDRWGFGVEERTANVPEGTQPVTSMIIDNLDTPIIIHDVVLHETLLNLDFNNGPVPLMHNPIYTLNLALLETTPREFCKLYRERCDSNCRLGMGCSAALSKLVDNNNRFLARIKAGRTTANARCNWDEPVQYFTVLVADMRGSTQREDLLNKWTSDMTRSIMGWEIALRSLYAANDECRILGIDSNECYHIVRDLCDKQNQAADLYQRLYQRATRQN